MIIWHKIDGDTPPPTEPLHDGDAVGRPFIVWVLGSSIFSIAEYDERDGQYNLNDIGIEMSEWFTHWAEIPTPVNESVER